tara:strand:- start:1285 stop:1458 length:174 start_codon:yes stop_codon:yes gene_type:complete
MERLNNNQIIEMANLKLIWGHSENKVCDWVFQQCSNDKKASRLLAIIFDCDEVTINL